MTDPTFPEQAREALESEMDEWDELDLRDITRALAPIVEAREAALREEVADQKATVDVLRDKIAELRTDAPAEPAPDIEARVREALEQAYCRGYEQGDLAQGLDEAGATADLIRPILADLGRESEAPRVSIMVADSAAVVEAARLFIEAERVAIDDVAAQIESDKCIAGADTFRGKARAMMVAKRVAVGSAERTADVFDAFLRLIDAVEALPKATEIEGTTTTTETT